MTHEDSAEATIPPPASYQQLLRYATDLARVYRAERAKRAALYIAGQTTRRILDSIGDAVLVVDQAGTVLDVNPAFCGAIGVTREAVVGARMDGISELAALTQGAGELSGAREQVFEIALPQGPPRYLEARVSPYTDGAGHPLGRVWALRDITAEKRADETRKEFLAIVSHELRTPLTAVLGFAELLDMAGEGTLPDDQRAIVGRIVENAKLLRDIVEQVLAFTTAGTEATTFAPETVDLVALAGDVAAAFQERATDAGVAIAVRSPSEHVFMTADGVFLRRALEQIVDNAIAFNRRGGSVEVRVEATAESAAISIADTGEGIPPAEMERIFDPFYRVAHYMTGKARGLGLGLALAQRIVRQHGGTIDVASRLGVGSTFTVHLPFARRES